MPVVTSRWGHDLFFNQPYPLERISLLRILTVAIALVMLACGPYDTSYHIDAASIMYRVKLPFLFIGELGAAFAVIKFSAVFVGLLALLGLYTRWTMPLFTVGYGLLNFVIHSYQNHYCMNQAHLNFILVFLCFAKTNSSLALDALRQNRVDPSKKDRDYASWVLTFQALLSRCCYFKQVCLNSYSGVLAGLHLVILCMLKLFLMEQLLDRSSLP